MESSGKERKPFLKKKVEIGDLTFQKKVEQRFAF